MHREAKHYLQFVFLPKDSYGGKKNKVKEKRKTSQTDQILVFKACRAIFHASSEGEWPKNPGQGFARTCSFTYVTTVGGCGGEAAVSSAISPTVTRQNKHPHKTSIPSASLKPGLSHAKTTSIHTVSTQQLIPTWLTENFQNNLTQYYSPFL